VVARSSGGFERRPEGFAVSAKREKIAEAAISARAMVFREGSTVRDIDMPIVLAQFV